MKKIFWISILCLMVFTLFVYLWAADSGWRNGTTFSNVSGGGVDWWEYGRAVSSDNSRSAASLAVEVTDYSDPLRIVDITGDAIPDGATIDGIEVQIEKCQSVADQISDRSVRLVVGGTATGDEKAGGGSWPVVASEAYTTYGGATDKWGLTPTEDQVNGATFGVQISGQNTTAAETSVAYIDHIQIKIYYTEAVTGIKKQVIGNLQTILR